MLFNLVLWSAVIFIQHPFTGTGTKRAYDIWKRFSPILSSPSFPSQRLRLVFFLLILSELSWFISKGVFQSIFSISIWPDLKKKKKEQVRFAGRPTLKEAETNLWFIGGESAKLNGGLRQYNMNWKANFRESRVLSVKNRTETSLQIRQTYPTTSKANSSARRGSWLFFYLERFLL